MRYISICWSDYLADPIYWQNMAADKAIALHISMDPPKVITEQLD